MMTNWSNNVLYIGVTNNLLRRTLEHKSKTVQGFTQKYNLYKLVYFEDYTNINQAIDREKQLKGWRREKRINWSMNLIKIGSICQRRWSD